MKRFLLFFRITFFALLTSMCSLNLSAQTTPVVTSNAIGASFSEGGSAIALNNQVTISSSSNITQIIIANRSGAAGAEQNDLITLGNPNGYTITSSANKANWILSGNGTAAQATAALQSAIYQNTGQNPTIFGTNNGRGYDLSVTNASGFTTNIDSGNYYSFGFALIINDAPTEVTTNTLTAANLGTTTISSAQLQAQDPDDRREGLIFTVNNTPSNGNLRLNGTPINVNGTFTQDDINNNRLSYQNTNGSASSDSFGFNLADGGENGASAITGQTFSINITSANNAPTASSFSVNPLNGSSKRISTAEFGYSDLDSDPLNNVLIEALPAVGTLYLDANDNFILDAGEQIGILQRISASDLNANRLKYIQNGAVATSFQFEVNDGTEDSSGNYIVTLNAVETLSFNVSKTNVSCNGGSDGSATGNGIGGVPPYTIEWSTGSGGGPVFATNVTMVDNLSAGPTVFRVQDDDGNSSQLNFFISEPAVLSASAVVIQNISAPDANDGIARANRTGGTSPYFYSWSNGATTQNISGLAAGTYTVDVSDTNGCTAPTQSVTITEPADTTAPTVTSITRQNPIISPTDADVLIWEVLFSENVNFVNPPDFELVGTTATINVTSVSDALYRVNAFGGDLADLNATITLQISNSQNIKDDANNLLVNTTPTGANESFTVVNITCPSPTALNTITVTATTATIFWTAGGSETEWEVVYGVSGFDPTSEGISVEVNNTATTNLTGLTGSTEYEIYVKAVCAENDESDFTGPVSFSTLLANDDCENAIALSCGDSVSGTTVGATESMLSTPSCTSGFPFDVFYTLAVEAGNEYTITVNGTNYDGVLVIYNGSCGSLTELACADNGFAANVAESITFSASTTEILTIRTYDWSINQGDFILNVSCATPEGFVYENGSWTPSDPNTNATASDNISVINGVTSITQALEVSNITVMSGAILNVEDVLTINGNITNNGNMVFKSTATKNGELAAVPSTSTITGDIKVERYMSDNRGYRMVSSPVTTSTSIHANWQEDAISATDNPNPGFGTHITGTTTDQQNGFDGTITGNASLYTLDVANQAFAMVGNTDVNTIDAGEGYLLFSRGSRAIDLTASPSPAADATILRTTGTLFTGTFTDNTNVSNVAGEFNLIGNPYQSAVNLNTVITDSQNLNGNFGYVYDPTLGDNGTYVTVMLPSGTNTSSSEANQYLQPGQGIQVATASNGATSVVFNESAKAPGNHTSTFRNVNAAEGMQIIGQFYTTENYVEGNMMHDSFGIYFSEEFTNEVTNEDAVKPFNFTENLGIVNGEEILSIERRAIPQENEEIQLFSNNYNYSNYTLVLNITELENSTVFLMDSYTNEEIQLVNGENIFTFSVDNDIEASIAENRFAFRFGEDNLGLTQASSFGLSLYPNPVSGESFTLKSTKLSNKKVSLKLTDVLGRNIRVLEESFQGSELQLQLGNLQSGTYLITIESEHKSETLRFIKR